MNTNTNFRERIHNVFSNIPVDGVLGIVDHLLTFCEDSHLEIIGHGPVYSARNYLGEVGEYSTLYIKKSIFRAVLARFAQMCIEKKSESMSLYGGTGKFELGTANPIAFRIEICNSADDQRLRVERLWRRKIDGVVAFLKHNKSHGPLKVDGVVRSLMGLGNDAITEIRDPNNWAAIELAISQRDEMTSFLDICGIPLMHRWHHSMRRELNRAALAWIKKRWRKHWKDLDDDMKFELTHHLADDARKAKILGKQLYEIKHRMPFQ